MTTEQLDIFAQNFIPSEVQQLILSHLNIKELLLTIKLVNKNWKLFAEQLIKDKIELKRHELISLIEEYQLIRTSKDRNVDSKEKMQEEIAITRRLANEIHDIAQCGYLPLLWEKINEADNEKIKENKKCFNVHLRNTVLMSLIYFGDDAIKYKTIGGNLQSAYLSECYLIIQDCTGWNLKNANVEGSCINLIGGNFKATQVDEENIKKASFINTPKANISVREIVGFWSEKFQIIWKDAAPQDAIKFYQEKIIPCVTVQHIEEGEDLSGKNLRHLKNLKVTEIFMASSIRDIELNENEFSNNEISKIKNRMLEDYEKFFSQSSDVNEILDVLIETIKKENHFLKYEKTTGLLKRFTSDKKDVVGFLVNLLDDYGKTYSYAEVIKLGRARLAYLAKQPGFVRPAINDEQTKKFQFVFLTNMYDWRADFWDKDKTDNAAEVLKSILNPDSEKSEKVEYQFNKMGN
jgi:hypothetical protein